MSGAKVNLAQVYVQERNFPAAITLLREAIVIEPYNVTAAYTLATALTRSGAQADGQLAMERFQTLRDSTYGNTYAQTYLAQGKYAEALASTGAEPDLVDPTPPKLTFADATTTMMPGPTPGGASAGSTGSVTLVDVDHDGDPGRDQRGSIRTASLSQRPWCLARRAVAARRAGGRRCQRRGRGGLRQ